MALNIDPKLVVMAAIAVPVAYQFLGWDFSLWMLVALGGAGWYYFDNNFVNKADVEKRDVPQLGPQQPFRSPEPGWEIGPDGTPIPKYQPPPQQYPSQPPQQR